MKSISVISPFYDFFYLTLLYRYRASDFQFPFGPSTSVLPFGQAQAELRAAGLKKILCFDFNVDLRFCDFCVTLLLHSKCNFDSSLLTLHS